MLLPFILLALAAGACCSQPQHGAPRALLQASLQIPQNCSNGFTQAYPLCADAKQRVPGSLCCGGLSQLGAECLGMVAASLSSAGAGGTAATQLTNTLSGCQTTLGGAPTAPPLAASPPAAAAGGCAAGFSAALSACGSGAACCGPVQALGSDCLQELDASTDGLQAIAFGQIARDCGWGGSNATDDLQLPDGEVRTWWRSRDTAVPCADYAGGEFVNATGLVPGWEATGSDMPADSEIISLGERWCSSQSGAVDNIFSALDAGGHSAQVAQATVLYYRCANGTRLWDTVGGALINDPRLNGPDALRYLRAFVAAADCNGANFCITVVVLSTSTSAVLFKEAIHVGPSPDSSEGCARAFWQLKVFCGSYAAAPPGYCCDELAALGGACLASLGSGLSADDLSTFNQLSRACSASPASPGAPAPPTSGGPAPSPGAGLPQGTATLRLNTGETAACSAYDAATGWSDLSNSSWAAASAYQKPAAADIQAFALQMCPLSEAAGPLLLQAIEAGGQGARVAVACIVAAVNSGTCSNETARAAARSAFLQAVVDLDDPERQIRVLQAFVDACDVMGAGACALLAVYSPDAGLVLFQTSIHTSVGAGSAAASPPAVARRLLRCSHTLPPRQTMWGVRRGCLA
ncbi:hypothetical protein ABPG75_008516 [Micractinium tetrahymenae]